MNKHVESYFIEDFPCGIIHLLFNVDRKGIIYHGYTDNIYSFGETEEELSYYNSIEIPKDKLNLEGNYMVTHTQCKDQISFYFIPFDLVGLREGSKLIYEWKKQPK